DWEQGPQTLWRNEDGGTICSLDQGLAIVQCKWCFARATAGDIGTTRVWFGESKGGIETLEGTLNAFRKHWVIDEGPKPCR
ncbi:Hypothetical predicted protein, partial [Podarcis lilfordi]